MLDVRTLEHEGYVSIPYPKSLRSTVASAMEAWSRFCALPFEEKRKVSGGDRIRDFGYMLRTDKGPRADSKELFHVLRHKIGALKKHAETVADPRAVAFIDAADQLIAQVRPVVCEFARAVEHEYGVTGLERDTAESTEQWTFRFLHYFGGEMLAHPHVDRGGFTLHLYESDGGGEYLDLQGGWETWPVSHERTIIFPSMTLQHRSEGRLKALYHRVRPTVITGASGRFALVCFVDFNSSHLYDESKGRLQEFPEGFNYIMPFREFSELFAPVGA